MLELYFAPNTISIAIAIALEESGLDYCTKPVNFAASEQMSEPYASLNPKGRVPTLVTEHGPLTETGAILDYIHSLAPQKGLVPSDVLASAKMREAMFYFASTMHVNHAHKLRGSRWADKEASWEDMRAKVSQTMTASCDYVEKNLIKGPFILGETFSLADPYLYMISTWATGDGVDLSRFPKLLTLMAEMEKRPSVQAVKAAKMLF
ncbi:MAG: glutathione S-transferase family protein [Cohaesibacter sp.]|nr:glutathione S-transferase family protein [Cohaesibacter sp.]MCV6601544.1 glutathione S-transferase family protein [Cohaesibacter sp.]